MVTHNHADTVATAVAAACAQQPPPAQIVVIDNASSDGSADQAATAGSAGPVEVVRQATNTGFCAAVNRALAATASPWILLLNPDCAPRPDFVRRLRAAAVSVRRPDLVGAVTGQLLRADGPELEANGLIDAAGMVVTASGRHLDRGAGLRSDRLPQECAWVFGGTGAALLLQRAALDDVAYPDGQVLPESFFAYREDAELAWRLQLRGWRCLYVPQAVAIHRRGLRPERGRRQAEVANYHSVKNRFLLRVHCADWRWHVRFLPWWLLRDLLVVAACATIERTSWPALGEALRWRHDALERRHWVLSRAIIPRQTRDWFRRHGRVRPVEAL
jgi:GT2 family glycosyltransferase